MNSCFSDNLKIQIVVMQESVRHVKFLKKNVGQHAENP